MFSYVGLAILIIISTCVSLNIPYEPYLDLGPTTQSVYNITNDSSVIRPDVFKRVALKFKFNELHCWLGKCPNHYIRLNGILLFNNLEFFTDSINASDGRIIEKDSIRQCQQISWKYGLRLSGMRSEVRATNLLLCLHSAYHQEIDSNYKHIDSIFKEYPPKSYANHWKNCLISTGYAAQQAYKDNPYSENAWLGAGLGYGMELMSYITILDGLFFCKTREDKFQVPIVGVSCLFFWKIFFGGVVIGSDVLEYNTIANSGYRIPKYLLNSSDN